MTAQLGLGQGGVSRSVTTSCWGRRQRITLPKALNLLTKLPQATLPLMQLFPQGTGQQLPSNSLEVWGGVGARLGGWGSGEGTGCMMKAARLTFLWLLKVLASKAHCPSWAQVLGLQDDVDSVKRGGGGSLGDLAVSQAGWAGQPWHLFQQLWASALGQASFAAFGPGNASSGMS